MKSLKDLAIAVMRANIPQGALTVDDEPIAYHGTNHGRIHAYEFKANGRLAFHDVPLSQAAGGGMYFTIRGVDYEVPRGFLRAQVAINLTEADIVIPGDVSVATGRGAQRRYHDRKVAEYVAVNAPEGFAQYPALPHVALRVEGNKLKVWRVSLGKVLGHKFYEGRDGTKEALHSIINGTAIVDGVTVKVDASGAITGFSGHGALSGNAMPPQLAWPDHAADIEFQGTPVPPGLRTAPGLRAWYRGTWRLSDVGPQACVEFKWGETAAHTVPIDANGEVTVLGLRYSVAPDFQLSVL